MLKKMIGLARILLGSGEEVLGYCSGHWSESCRLNNLG